MASLYRRSTPPSGSTIGRECGGIAYKRTRLSWCFSGCSPRPDSHRKHRLKAPGPLARRDRHRKHRLKAPERPGPFHSHPVGWTSQRFPGDGRVNGSLGLDGPAIPWGWTGRRFLGLDGPTISGAGRAGVLLLESATPSPADSRVRAFGAHSLIPRARFSRAPQPPHRRSGRGYTPRRLTHVRGFRTSCPKRHPDHEVRSPARYERS